MLSLRLFALCLAFSASGSSHEVGKRSIASYIGEVSSPSDACDFFRQTLPDKTFSPGDALFINETQVSWSATAWLEPACVVAPASAEEVSLVIKTLASLSTPFAMRGGGHMPISDAANINSTGVLLSSTNLNQVSLSEDKSYVSVGPGNHWAKVYEPLEPHGLTVVGGRMGVVGVPGFLLGGGISFFGNEHGWASANIRAYECVLANGQVVEATADNDHADLFWALRGGGNNFCFVTRFDLNTISAPEVYLGQLSHGPGVVDKWLDAVFDWAVNGSDDVKSAITPVVNYGYIFPVPTYNEMVFYSGNESSPAALENFTGPNFPPVSSTLARRSMFNWTLETDAPFKDHPDLALGQRQKFFVISFSAEREVMGLIHDVYITAAQEQLANVTGFITGLAYNVITKSYLAAGTPDPMGVDVSKAPYIWLEESISWTNAEDDPKVEAFLEYVNANITSEVKTRGLESPYLYLNDADKGQPVFEGYADGSLNRLKCIRNKYDPTLVFTNLVPGGFKVAHA